jgi:hypothetical protein
MPVFGSILTGLLASRLAEIRSESRCPVDALSRWRVSHCSEGSVAGQDKVRTPILTKYEPSHVRNLTPRIISKGIEVFGILPASHDNKEWTTASAQRSTTSIFMGMPMSSDQVKMSPFYSTVRLSSSLILSQSSYYD